MASSSCQEPVVRHHHDHHCIDLNNTTTTEYDNILPIPATTTLDDDVNVVVNHNVFKVYSGGEKDVTAAATAVDVMGVDHGDTMAEADVGAGPSEELAQSHFVVPPTTIAEAASDAVEENLLVGVEDDEEEIMQSAIVAETTTKSLTETLEENTIAIEEGDASHESTVKVAAVENSLLNATAEDALTTTTEEERVPPFAMGDHIYRWCHFAFVAPFQHHAIVLDVYPDPYQEDEWLLKIADFSRGEYSHKETESKGRFSKAIIPSVGEKAARWKPHRGCLRVYESSAKDWLKVKYGAGFFERNLFSSTGTCTAAQCDAAGLVRARVQFLLEHPEVLPDYQLVGSNCECVAVWCKTGTWATVQAASWLTLTALGQVKSAMTVAGVAASTQVTVPAAGLWGWMGYTTHVSLLSTQPMLVPMIAAYGIVTVSIPALLLLRSKKHCREQTIALNEAFWNSAVEHPDAFVDGITHWSALHEPI